MVQKSYKQENIIGFADVDYREGCGRSVYLSAGRYVGRTCEYFRDRCAISRNGGICMGGSAQSLSADAHAETRQKNHFRDMAGPMSASDLSAFVFDDRRVWLPHWRRAFHLDVVGCKKQRLAVNPKINAMFPDTEDLGVPVEMPRSSSSRSPTPACLLHAGLFRS